LQLYSLSEREMDRICVLRRLEERDLTQREAGDELGLSVRQIRRLYKRLKQSGPPGVKRLPQGGNRTFPEGFKSQVMDIVKKSYYDFGPTFASEKLLERNGLSVNRETLRQWMMEEGLWKGRARTRARVHQSRERRPRFGEMTQADGSHHAWFEDRGPKCCLIVMIDDATSKIMYIRFEESETTLGYMRGVLFCVQQYGRPMAYYTDKHSIFKTTRHTWSDGRIRDTQLHRALRSLDVELICAHSAQAKGRVERANSTLQDRLIKEMRLRNICTMEEGNAYLAEFMAKHNERFSVPADCPEDAHRPLRHALESLRRILSKQNHHKLSKNLEFAQDGIVYQVKRIGTGYALRGADVTLCEHMDGTREILYGEESVRFTTHIPQKRPPRVIERKTIDAHYANQFTDKSLLDGYTITHRDHSTTQLSA